MRYALLCGPLGGTFEELEFDYPEIRRPVFPLHEDEWWRECRVANDVAVPLHTLRYIRREIGWGDKRRTVYVWEYASPDDVLDALTGGKGSAVERAVAAEREACAELCDFLERIAMDGFAQRPSTNRDCAAFIRARGRV